MGLIGEVVKMGKQVAHFLLARVAVELAKPLRRGVLMKTDRAKPPWWFDIQFEKLSYYCFSCGLVGHLEIECPKPVPRNELGKLPYDLKLGAPDERRRTQIFNQATSESLGSASADKLKKPITSGHGSSSSASGSKTPAQH
jgi:hypothetical protein